MAGIVLEHADNRTYPNAQSWSRFGNALRCICHGVQCAQGFALEFAEQVIGGLANVIEFDGYRQTLLFVLSDSYPLHDKPFQLQVVQAMDILAVMVDNAALL